MRVAVERVGLRLSAPLVAAHGEVRERVLLQLTLEADDGLLGHGEAAPLEAYDGVPLGECAAALDDCRETLEAAREPRSDGERAQLLAACRERAVLPHAIAAVDLALWDLAGRRAGRPVWSLLGASGGGPIALNATIGASDRAGAAKEAAAAAEAGFRCVKLKVGIGDDAGRVAAVRSACGPGVALRLDANGAWEVGSARRTLATLAPAGIELCEEPVHGLAALAAVREAAPVPVAMDESAALPGALSSEAADAVCLKVAASGGIDGLLADAELARSNGMDVYLGSTLDGPLGIAAALHAAAVIEPDRPCGLATLGRFDLGADPLPAVGGAMVAPDAPGLGVEPLVAGRPS